MPRMPATALRHVEDLLRDFRGALRYFGRHRVFVATAVLVLALGIGGATAVFSVSETLLLRPLPYRDGERLVALRSYRPLDDFPFTRAAGGTLVDWQRQATSFDAVAGYRWGTLDVIDGVRSHRLSGLAATPEFFDVFGVALNGRAFAAADRGAGTLVLGHDAWRRLFGADDSLIGGTLDLHARESLPRGTDSIPRARRFDDSGAVPAPRSGLRARRRHGHRHHRFLVADVPSIRPTRATPRIDSSTSWRSCVRA